MNGEIEAIIERKSSISRPKNNRKQELIALKDSEIEFIGNQAVNNKQMRINTDKERGFRSVNPYSDVDIDR